MNIRILDEWCQCSSSIEKIVAIFVGFGIGDLIEEALYTFFSIDSFILSTITAMLSLFLTVMVFQLAREKGKNHSNKVVK